MNTRNTSNIQSHFILSLRLLVLCVVCPASSTHCSNCYSIDEMKETRCPTKSFNDGHMGFIFYYFKYYDVHSLQNYPSLFNYMLRHGFCYIELQQQHRTTMAPHQQVHLQRLTIDSPLLPSTSTTTHHYYQAHLQRLTIDSPLLPSTPTTTHY